MEADQFSLVLALVVALLMGHLSRLGYLKSAALAALSFSTATLVARLLAPDLNGATVTALAVSLAVFSNVLVLRLRSTPKNLPPGPWALPWLGYLPFIDAGAPYETLTKLKNRYGKVYAVQLGQVAAVVVSDPKLVRQAFAQEAFSGRAPLYLTHGIMQGYGLVCSEGEMWREHRRFISGVMRELGMTRRGDGTALTEARIMDRVTEFLQSLKDSKGQPMDVVPKLRHCIGNVINGIVFGIHYAEDDPTWIWLQHLLDEGFKHVAVAGPLNFLPILRHLPKFKKTMSFIMNGKVETHKHYREIIDDHAKHLENDATAYVNVIEAYLIEMKRRRENPGTFTMTQLYHVLADMFGAGTDTALTTIKWILLYVILYQDVQKKIQEELDRVVGSQRYPSIDDIAHLPYTEAVILEVQRIRNVLPLGVPHGTVQDTTLGGYDIPKETMVIPLLCAINMDPELWDNPERFVPGRFIDPATNRVRKPDYFMPFQTGRRMCIGEDFGRMTMFLFTATVLQQFHLKFPEGFTYDEHQRPEYGFTLVPQPYEIVAVARL